MKDKLKLNEFVEVLYQIISRNFNPVNFLKDINYPIIEQNKADLEGYEKSIAILLHFFIWIIMCSVMKHFHDLYSEILDSFLKLCWDRSKAKRIYGNYDRFLLWIKEDFAKYNNALFDKNDPIFKLSVTVLNNIFGKENEDIRALFHIVSHFHETSKAYDKIFKKIKLIKN
jgi:hypothetical protein